MTVSVEATCRHLDIADPAEISIGALVRFLAGYPDHPVMFMYDGRDVKAGYDVSGIRAGQFSVLDGSADLACWTEICVQLHVGVGDGHLTAQKLGAIIRQFSDKVSFPSSARLTVEVSNASSPIELQKVAEPEVVNGKIRIVLTPRALPPTGLGIPQSETASAGCCGGCC